MGTSHNTCGQASLELSVDPADVAVPTNSSIEENPDDQLGVAIVFACLFVGSDSRVHCWS